jgi:tRNA-Thr(GGU) m(6)t(6)A37 methyltransferase TsaA
MMVIAELKPIGTVRCDVKDRPGMTTFGVPAVIEVFPEFADGLRHLQKHSHLWVLAWLHEADRDRLLVTPRGVADQTELGKHGVFAVRSPTRPNPIAMTAAKVERIDGLRIYVDRLDFFDGTPVIDLKPYFRSRDAIHSAKSDQVGRPAGREALLASLLYQAENFHGERCGGLALGARIVEHLRSIYFDFAEIAERPELVARVPSDAGCLIDVVMALTGATPGRGLLKLHEDRSVRFVKDNQTYEYRLHEPGRRWPAWIDLNYEQVCASPETELFSVYLTAAR